MDQLAAMKFTITTIEKRLPTQRATGPGMDLNHFRDMVERAESEDMSPAKLGRWLGWIQGVAAARGLLTLSEAKEINKRFAD